MNYLIKRTILIILFLNLHGLEARKESFFKFGIGPSWFNLNSLETAEYKNITDQIRETEFKINRASGIEIELITKLRINTYLNPYILFIFDEYKRGNGFLKATNKVNNREINTVEFQNFTPNIRATTWTITNQFNLFEKKINKHKLRLELLAGYNKIKTSIIADWQEDSSITITNWHGFFGGLKFFYNITKKTAFSIYDYIYPERLDTISTRDSILGADAGTETFKFFGNAILFNLIHSNDNFIIELSFEWLYAKNIGKATINLLDAELDAFENPKLCFLKQNQYNLLALVGFRF
jgi:hypothetical protein